MTDPLPPGRDFLASLGPDVRKLLKLMRLWRECRLGGSDLGTGQLIADDADALIDQLRAQLHAAQLQLADERREHHQAVAARRAEVLAAKPRATRGRPAALRHEHERARRDEQEAPH